MPRIPKFFILLHKNILLFRHSWWNTLFIIIFPLLLSSVLLVLRNEATRTDVANSSHWPAFDLKHLPKPPFGYKLWSIAYAPNDSYSTNLMTVVGHTLHTDTEGFSSEQSLLDFLSSREKSVTGTLGAVIINGSLSSADITYSIRLRNKHDWDTNLLFMKYPRLSPRSRNITASPPDYWDSGFLAIQHAVDHAYLQANCNATGSLPIVNLSTEIKRMPYPPYLDDDFMNVIQQQLSFVIVQGLVFSVLTSVRLVLVEKNARMKVMDFSFSNCILSPLSIFVGNAEDAWFGQHNLLDVLVLRLHAAVCRHLHHPHGDVEF